MNTASFAAKIQAQMGRFSGKLSAGLPKVAARLVGEVINGVQSRGSVRLSEIGRALDLPVALMKVIERLGRQLERERLKEKLQENLVALRAEHVGEDTLLLLDPTDITKPYAKKMQYLARVMDGSTGESRFRKTFIKEEAKGEKVFHLVFGGCSVRFPGYERKLYLVVIDGYGKEPLLLLTAMEIGHSRKRLWRVVESYLARWAGGGNDPLHQMASKTSACSPTSGCGAWRRW